MSDKSKDNYVYKKDFVEDLAEKLDISKQEANEVFDAVLDVLKDTWSKKNTLCISNFGVFELRPMKQRMGRNPKTMQEYVIPEMYRPLFRPTKVLRDEINANIRLYEANEA